MTPAVTMSAAALGALLRADPGAGRPAYRHLAERLRRLIGDGRVAVGTKLPSERELTAHLGVSRTTVTRAYAVLRDSGYLTSQRGSGSLAQLPGGSLPGHGPLTLRPTDPDAIDLTYAALPASPGTLAAYERALARLPRHLAVPGYEPIGLAQTRGAIAAWFTDRGLATSPAQIVVTAGANAGVAALAAALLRPGDRVVVESPTYPNVLHTLRSAHLRPVGVPVTGHGWDVAAVEQTMRRSGAKLAYLVPDFHNPTGALMSEQVRAQVVSAVVGAGAWVLVDETFVDLALDGAPMPPPTAAFSDRVITVGGVSKAFWGGVRVGWIRLPEELVEPVVRARYGLDLGTAILEQLVTEELLADRQAILAQRRPALLGQRDALVAALHEHLPDWTFQVPTGGVNLWCQLPAPHSRALVHSAAASGLWLAPGGQFSVHGRLESFLRLPYTLAPEQLREAARRLCVAWQDTSDSATADGPWPPLLA